MMNSPNHWLAALAVTVASFTAAADQWQRPETKEVFSASRDYFVRVTPGESIGDTWGFKGAKKGEYATAEFYRREKDRSYKLVAETSLPNPVAPVEFYVANNGHLITLDNWHNRGFGRVVVVLAPDGKQIKSYRLADLFLDAEIEAFSHSTSSIRWHEGPTFFQQDQKTLLVTIKTGASIEIDIVTGSFQLCETQGTEFRCRNSNKDRKWRGYASPE